MTQGMGSFIAGIEDLSFVDRVREFLGKEKPKWFRTLVVGLLAVLVLFAVVCVLFVQGEPEETLELTSERRVLEAPSTSFDEVSARDLTETPSVPQPSEFVVYVSGAVASPGVYTFNNSSRITDAVDAAGGLLPDAASAVVNLAAPLVDGMQIHIPLLSEVSEDAPGQSASSLTEVNTDPAGATEGAVTLVNINTADSETLQTLDGIGPATAQKIIDYRSAHGKFTSKEDLKQVSGIGDKKYAALEARITV